MRNLENEFLSNYSELDRKIQKVEQEHDYSNQQEIKQNLKVFEQSFKQMLVEIQNITDLDHRQNKKNQLKQFRQYLNIIKNRFKQIENHHQIQEQKSNLFTNSSNTLDIETKESLQFLKQNDKLVQAKQELYQTESTAISIKNDLHEQTGRLQSAIKRVKLVFADLSQSNSLITNMQQRILRNKITYYFTCFMIILITLTVAYLKFY